MTIAEEKPAEVVKVPFGVDHVKAVCREILLPPKVAEKKLIWGWRLNHLDLASSYGYRWPFPGNWAEAKGPFLKSTDPCPSHPGDGLCIAKTISGAQSGTSRFGKSVGLLVAYLPEDLLAESGEKLRVKRAWVADMFDPVRALTEAVRGADLGGADLGGAYLGGAYLGSAYLRGADLGGADLGGADLGGADLGGAYLRSANLRGANLGGADLGGADLGGADLGGAYLGSANLRGANLGSANLRGANLGSADLGGADLGGADLGGADLGGAYLGSAYLGGADLGGARYTQLTIFPSGFDAQAAGAIKVD